METIQHTPINPHTYQEYLQLQEKYVLENSCSGLEKTTERIEANKLNLTRMRRLDKTTVVPPDLIRPDSFAQHWTVITESWCGDSAQILPVIAKLAEANRIPLEIVYRDENPDLMNWHLTNGSRAIPKLIVKDTSTGKVITTWGPRPAAIQQKVNTLKTEFPEMDHDTFVTEVQKYYNSDKAQAIFQDFKSILLNG